VGVAAPPGTVRARGPELSGSAPDREGVCWSARAWLLSVVVPATTPARRSRDRAVALAVWLFTVPPEQFRKLTAP
jgi:hypothetical protein